MAKSRDELFSPNARYFVQKGFRLFGKDYTPGEAFDNKLVTTRLLRQLYDMKNLELDHSPAMLTPEQAKMVQYVTGIKPTPTLDIMTDDELAVFLKEQGITPRSSWNRAKLLQKAKEKVAA